MNPTWNDPDHEDLDSLARLYRENAPREPAWEPTLARIEARLQEQLPPKRRWRVAYLMGLVATAAAVLVGVLLARPLWVGPSIDEDPMARGDVVPPEDDQPYPVARLSEVNILGMHPDDADRVLTGQPLLGPFEFVKAGDVEINEIDPGPEEVRPPRLRRGNGAPMIVVARTKEAKDEDDDP